MDLRNLVVVLGDQLDSASGVFEDFDPQHDRVWMAEVSEEATHVPAHKARIALYLSAMRHFRHALEAAGLPVIYRAVGEHELSSLQDALGHDLNALRPHRLVVCEPGEWRVLAQLQDAAASAGVPLEVRPDRHFLCTAETFEDWARERSELRLMSFYRFMRRETGVLMNGEGPVGGRWCLDADAAPQADTATGGEAPTGFAPDSITWGVLARVKRHYPEHTGTLQSFDWPVTAAQAERSLTRFLEHNLSQLRRAQAANAPWDHGAHAHLSAALNLKLLSPRQVIDAAVAAHRDADVPLAAVERLVREVLGWREFLRGLYRHLSPDHRHANALGANRPLPAFYWSGDTDMMCLRETLAPVLTHGYSQPVARFTVTGLFALLLGVHPLRLQHWNLALGADAVEWLESPVTFGPSQFADAGRWSQRPHVASGRHVQRTTGYCQNCRYRPEQPLGDDGCPFTTLYWDFLARHRNRPALQGRLTPQWRELEQLDGATLAAIRRRAALLKERFAPIHDGLAEG